MPLPGFLRGRCLFDQVRGPVCFLDQVIQGTDFLLYSFRLVLQFGEAEVRRGRVFCVFSQPDQVFVKLQPEKQGVPRVNQPGKGFSAGFPGKEGVSPADGETT